MDGALGLTALFGGLLLAAVLFYAAMRNRKISAGQKARSEAATHDLYAAEDRDAKRDEVAP